MNRGVGVLACYCFDITVGEVADAGTEAISRIREGIRGGACRCAERNPSGKCCLGDVYRLVAKSDRSG